MVDNCKNALTARTNFADYEPWRGAVRGDFSMKNRIATAAFAAVLGFIQFAPAHATAIPVPDPTDFSIVETPGRYTVFNNSADWYIYAFAVSNPAAENSSATATTTFSNWGPDGLKLQLDLNTGTPLWSFGYKSPDADISDPNDPHLTSFNLGTYLGPHSSSDLFFFTPGVLASNFGMLLVDANEILGNVNGVTSASATPLPAALPMFMAGGGLIGLIARRKKQKRA